MKLEKQHAPFSIQIEPTEGCNLGCSFCGLRGMRKKGTEPWNYMSKKTAVLIADEIARMQWKSKIIFAMHGEPTLNPKIFSIIKIFRKRLPKTIFHLITNGYGICNDTEMSVLEYVTHLKECGINNLLVDAYSSNKKEVELIRQECGSFASEELKPGIPMFSSKKEFRILYLPPILTEKISLVRNLSNHCGAAFELDYKHQHKRCAMPFRELSFRYDGSVALCCDDFRGEYPISSIYEEENIEKIWNHKRFQAARVMLYNKRRDFKPCLGCTNISVRVGFLPDPSGQDELPEPTSDIVKLAKSVSVNNEPLSKIIVKRPWEKY